MPTCSHSGSRPPETFLTTEDENFPEQGESREQGFTIIEVLVAVALFAIVVLVILAPLTGLYGLTQKSGQ